MGYKTTKQNQGISDSQISLDIIGIYIYIYNQLTEYVLFFFFTLGTLW